MPTARNAPDVDARTCDRPRAGLALALLGLVLATVTCSRSGYQAAPPACGAHDSGCGCGDRGDCDDDAACPLALDGGLVPDSGPADDGGLPPDAGAGDACGSGPDPCAAVDCGDAGVCGVVNGASRCVCEPGYVSADGPCVPASAACLGMDCDDGLYCNGVEGCLAGACIPGVAPCVAAGLACDEASDSCLDCGDGVRAGDEDCDPGAPRADHCCDPATCTWVAAGDRDPQGVCYSADVCRFVSCGQSGACAEQTLAAGSACLDHSPGDCALARCTASATCDQNAALKAYGEACDDGLFCNGVDRCDASGSCALHLGDPCAAQLTLEDFDGLPSGELIRDQPGWFGAANSPALSSSADCASSVGLAPGFLSFVWVDRPFDWNDPDFTRIVVGGDFQASNAGEFKDDRVGWIVAHDSTDSARTFGVQLDAWPQGDGMFVEGYWDSASTVDVRVPMATLDGLITARAWYRVRATFTKLGPSAAHIAVSVWALDGSCAPAGAPLVSAAIADTGALGASSPAARYFEAPTLWPLFKNNSDIDGSFDNAYVEIVYGEGGVCDTGGGACVP